MLHIDCCICRFAQNSQFPFVLARVALWKTEPTLLHVVISVEMCAYRCSPFHSTVLLLCIMHDLSASFFTWSESMVQFTSMHVHFVCSVNLAPMLMVIFGMICPLTYTHTHTYTYYINIICICNTYIEWSAVQRNERDRSWYRCVLVMNNYIFIYLHLVLRQTL